MIWPEHRVKGCLSVAGVPVRAGDGATYASGIGSAIQFVVTSRFGGGSFMKKSQ